MTLAIPGALTGAIKSDPSPLPLTVAIGGLPTIFPPHLTERVNPMNEDLRAEGIGQYREITKAEYAEQNRRIDASVAKQSADPWVHRSDNMLCKKCIWFVPKQPNSKLGYDLGRCRRHAPTMGGYPVVFVNDWCGDHRLDENKI